MDIASLQGRRATFIPHYAREKNYGSTFLEPTPVRGIIDVVNAKHGWFAVSYWASGIKQHECFKACDIGTAVTINGNKKDR